MAADRAQQSDESGLQDAEVRRRRLRDQIKDQDDVGQRAMVRNWVIELMVDHEQLRESFDNHAQKTGQFIDTVQGALFEGDKASGAPGLVPFTRRISSFADSCCRIFKWTAGIGVTLAGLIPLIDFLRNFHP